MTWTDGIPKIGVLCRRIINGSIVRICEKTIRKELGEILVDDSDRIFSPKEVVPLTPQEWWQLAPWSYDIDSAPKDIDFLTKDVDGDVLKTWWSKCHSKWTRQTSFKQPIAWLPLPEHK